MSSIEQEAEVFEPVVSGTTGRAIVAIVGLALWAQIVIGALALEVSLAMPSPLMLAAYVTPPIILIAGTYLNSLPVLLFGFPLTLLVATGFVPEADKATYFTPFGMGRIAATFALYLALASAWATSSRMSTSAGRQRLDETEDESVLQYRNHVLARLGPLLLLWAVPTYAIYFDQSVVGTFRQSFGDAATIAQVFVSTAFFLVWAIIAYTSYIVPALNMEYDRRRLWRDYRRDGGAFDRRSIHIRLAATVGAGAVLVLILLLLTS